MSQTPVRNCQWRSSFFDVDQSVVEKIKILGKENGVRTLNPILQTAWAFALRSVQGHTMSPFVLKTTAVKDTRARDKGDPYCLGMFSVSSIHLMEPNDDSEFWEIARQYADGFDSALDKGVDLLRMLNFLPTAPITPSLSSIGFTHDASPQGDKRAHNRLEAMLAEKIADHTI